MLGIDLRALLLSALVAFWVATVATIAFLGVNRLSLEMDAESIAKRLRHSFVVAEAWTDPERAGSYNDCLLGAMAILRGFRTTELTVSAPRIYKLHPPFSVCSGLKHIVLGHRPDASQLDPEDYVVVLYHQYWTGQRVLLSFALSFMGTREYRWLLYGLSYGFLLIGVGVASARLARQWPTSAKIRVATDRQQQKVFVDFATLALLLGFLLFLNLPTQGASFDTAPPFILIFGLAVSALFINYAEINRHLRAIIFAGYGAVIAYLELLTGALLLGLIAVIVILSLQRFEAKSQTSALTVLISGVVAYGVGFAVCIALKIAVIELFLDIRMVDRFFDLLTYRMTGDERTTFGDRRLGYLFDAGDVSIFFMVKRIGGFGARHLGFGSMSLGLIIGGLSAVIIAATAAAAIRHWRRLYDPVQVFGLLSGPALLGLWYLMFKQHTAQHPEQMSRCLAIVIAVAAMFCIAVWLRMPTPFREIRGSLASMRTALRL